MRWLLKKILGLPLLVGFMNCLFILFSPNAFWTLTTLLSLCSINAFLCIDIVIRPVSTKQDQYPRIVPILAFLALPLILWLPYLEAMNFISFLLPPPFLIWMATLGLFVLFIGGILGLVSRIQLGYFGGPKIVIEEHHRLVTTGMYRYIRHPQYLAFLLLFFGYTVSLGSLFLTLTITLALFLIFRSRMNLEEELLTETFGATYSQYKKRTKRLIPFIY